MTAHTARISRAGFTVSSLPIRIQSHDLTMRLSNKPTPPSLINSSIGPHLDLKCINFISVSICSVTWFCSSLYGIQLGLGGSGEYPSCSMVVEISLSHRIARWVSVYCLSALRADLIICRCRYNSSSSRSWDSSSPLTFSVDNELYSRR